MAALKRVPPSPLPPVISLVSLGCAKNTVDSERLLASLVQAGFLIAENPADSDLCLVNTCGFIEDARRETGETLAELARLRAQGRPRKLIALGCLVERAGQIPDHGRFLAAADAQVGFCDYLRLPDLCRAWLRESPPPADEARPAPLPNAFHELPRLITGAAHSVCLKISEGCSNACRFCTIPRIRGAQISRTIEEIVAEAKNLAAAGAREIALIGQDTTSYGRDLYGRRRLAELLRALPAALPDAIWLRLMYAYPRFLDDDVLDALAADGRWCRYVDLPLQHISDRLLQRMGRGMGRDDTLRLLDRIAERLPGAALRTAFIVGHPGETGDDFAELLDFVREGRFLHLGVFAYSPEPGTPSRSLPDPVPAPVAAERREALMSAQREVSRRRLAAGVGQTVEVMVDGPAAARSGAPPGTRWLARTRGQAPDVDGVTWLRGPAARRPKPGEVLHARLAGYRDYDWIAEPRET